MDTKWLSEHFDSLPEPNKSDHMQAFTIWLALSSALEEGRIEFRDGGFTGDLDEWRLIASEMEPELAGRAWPEWKAPSNMEWKAARPGDAEFRALCLNMSRFQSDVPSSIHPLDCLVQFVDHFTAALMEAQTLEGGDGGYLFAPTSVLLDVCTLPPPTADF